MPIAVAFGIFVAQPANQLGYEIDFSTVLEIAVSVVLGLGVAVWSLLKVRHESLRLLAIPVAIFLALFAAAVSSAWGSVTRGPGFSSATFVETHVAEWATVSCPAPGRCVAFGSSFIFQPPTEFAAVGLITNGGRTWRAVAFPVAALFRATRLPEAGGYIVVAMESCATLHRCLIAQAEDAYPLQATELPIARSSNGGASWQILPAPLGPGGHNLGAGHGELVCMTASRCVLTDGRAIVLTRNAGASWRVVTFIRPPTSAVNEFSGVDCSDALHCAAYFSWESQVQVGSSLSFHNSYMTLLFTTVNGGQSWGRVLLPSGMGVISSLWCGGSGHCVLSATIDSTGPRPPVNTLAISSDTGRHWAVTSPSNSSIERELSCVSASECMAIGTVANTFGLLLSRDGGRSWRLNLPGDLWTFSCAGPRVCAVSGSSEGPDRTQRAFLETTMDGGGSWHRSWFPISRVPADQRPFSFR